MGKHKGHNTPAHAHWGPVHSEVKRMVIAKEASGSRPYVWQDLVTGKCHMVDNQTGQHVPCTLEGKPIRSFVKDLSGIASTSVRHAKVPLADMSSHLIVAGS